MNEEIIIKWTKNEDGELLIVNATIDNEKIIKVLSTDTDLVVEKLKIIIKELK